MALSNTTSPYTIIPAYNPIVWTIDSSSLTIVRVIADVYIDGTIRASIDKDPRFGTTATFDFDVQSVCQDYLTENLETISGNTTTDADNSEVKIKLELYEVVLTAGVLVTAWREDGSGTPDLTTSFHWAINAALQHEETQNVNAYILSSASQLFLTQSAKTLNLERTETAQLHFVSHEVTLTTRIESYNSLDVLVATTSSASTPTDKASVALIDGSTFTAATTYILVYVVDSLAATISETIRYNLIDTNCNDNALRLKWVNPLGGIDAYTFNAERREELRFTSSTYERVIEQGYAVKDRGDTILKTTGKDSIGIFSKVLTKAELVWLSQIGLSNNVWIDEGSNVFVPVIVTSRKVKTLNSSNKIFQANFKLIKANERITHKG